jgi:SH3 domain protein
MRLSLKIGALVLSCLFLSAIKSEAETKYVIEDLTITLRTGPGTDHKIIAFPVAGDSLEVISANNEYTEVEDHNGKQGFVLTRYLTEKEPARRILARFSQEYSQLQAKYAALKQSSGELTLENQNLTDELAKITQDLKALTVEHDHLKRDSGQYLELKTKYARAVKSAAETQARAEKIEKELAQLYSSEINTGLLYGGGLIVLGFITGYIVKRPKRRTPLI